MEKEFVPYELALELRNLGFDDHVFAFYWTDTKQLILDSPNYLGKHNGVHLQAPLWQQAFDWFRDEFDYNVSIYGRKSMGYDYRINNVLINSVKDTIVSSHVWETYEEARQACLEKLIEIVKEK